MYFEAQQPQQSQPQSAHHQQQQQPFQIRRIEELNKTAGGNVEAKVMCFYRRRDLPAQLVALADKHQQHQQQQQLSLTMSLSPGGNGTVKGVNKTAATIKSSTSDKDVSADKKDQDTVTSGAQAIVKKEQQPVEEESTPCKVEATEVTETVKEEQKQDVEMTETAETDSVSSAVIKSGDTQGDDGDITDKCKYLFTVFVCLSLIYLF